MERAARASSANEVRASEGSMASTAASRGEWSSVTSLITCTREPNASVWPRFPGPSAPMSDLASCLARASRSPARMLSELSTANMVISPVRCPARMVRLRYGLANASASRTTSAVRSASNTR